MVATIAAARAALQQGNRKEYDRLKRSLPAFCFMATFDKNRGSSGQRPENNWRLQSAARLNGLVMLDFDHLEEDPRQVFARIPDHWRDDDCASQILLAHVTPSGQGLRIVCKADARRGNLADNQLHLSNAFKLNCDEAVKNADRLSFAPAASDIIYLDKQIFTYSNDDYDKMFGDNYRHSNSQPSKVSAHSAPAPADVAGGNGNLQNDAPGKQEAQEITLDKNAGGKYAYQGTPFSTIVERWLEKHGKPERGSRHLSALRLAADLRYLCDNNASNIRAVMALAPFVQDMVEEGGAKEIIDICNDVVNRKMNLSMPKNVAALLDSEKEAPGDGSDGEAPVEVYTEFWERLKPLLTEPYDLAVYRMDDANKLGGVFAAGAMFCTLMTRCWYRHFDGEVHRMNPQVYLIGDPASGKGEAEKIDQIIMSPVIVADKMGRDAEAEYKRQQKERSTSSKAQKGEALKRPEFCIRYLPSRTSNAVFFRRAKNAFEEKDGQRTMLHLYTFDSELDGNTTAQSGGSWIGKHDIELKAFHNEFTGVDYANADSVNEIIQVFYNSVVTGTPVSLSRKVTPRNINDGLCSRMAIFKMLSSDFKMIGRGNKLVIHEKNCKLKQWAFKMERLHGELKIDRLVDFVYKLCEDSALQAEAEGDKVLDYLRKRAVFYATWFTVPRIAARAIQQADKMPTKSDDGELFVSVDPMTLVTVEDSDLDFAHLIYDAVIYWQDYFFGRMLQESWNNAARDLRQRKRNSCNKFAFLNMPQEFSTKQLSEELKISMGAAAMQTLRWVEAGYLVRVKKGYFRKIIQNIE